ncbi:DUF1330 domain-containing protein [Aquimarina sediminis]|uniref:DUF1330 domain-containing protein n=1 Tax=Aquimarina sediminis TaxID=2070536 RepID=UPI000CA06730|nr:DUF1330 domain-containing protein [Aquimarina sediminis]
MSETFIETTPKQFKEFTSLPVEGPFQMFNLLKFKDRVEKTKISGAQAYAEYMHAVQPFFQTSKAKIIYHGKPMFNIIGPKEKREWDKILIVEYASKEDFLKMIAAEGYPSEMRNRALIDSRLIVCTGK